MRRWLWRFYHLRFAGPFYPPVESYQRQIFGFRFANSKTVSDGGRRTEMEMVIPTPYLLLLTFVLPAGWIIHWSRPGITGIALHRMRSDFAEGERDTSIAVTFYALVILFAVGPLLWLNKFRRCRVTMSNGLCPRCGYDLRATPERCPECGSKVKTRDADLTADERR